MPILRGLARRVLDRIGGPPAVGEGFGPGSERAFAQLDDAAEGAFSAVGAAVVSSWEVLLADLARALGQLPAERRARLVERVSDALVPTASPLTHAERPFKAALQGGVKAALRSGRLADATEPLCAHLETLGEPVAAGWGRTTAFMQPVYEALPEPDALRGALAFTGGELRAVFDGEAARFRAAMEALPAAPALEPALTLAFERWKEGVVRGVEVALYGARSRLVEAATRARHAG